MRGWCNESAEPSAHLAVAEAGAGGPDRAARCGECAGHHACDPDGKWVGVLYRYVYDGWDAGRGVWQSATQSPLYLFMRSQSCILITSAVGHEWKGMKAAARTAGSYWLNCLSGASDGCQLSDTHFLVTTFNVAFAAVSAFCFSARITDYMHSYVVLRNF